MPLVPPSCQGLISQAAVRIANQGPYRMHLQDVVEELSQRPGIGSDSDGL